METKADQPAAPKPSRAQLKSIICERVRAIAKSIPPAWQGWDYEQTHAFKKAWFEINPDNTLPKIVAAAKIIIPAYGRAVAEVIPEEALQ